MEKPRTEDSAIRARIEQKRNFKPLSIGQTHHSRNDGPDLSIITK